jgi:hypothetical protein
MMNRREQELFERMREVNREDNEDLRERTPAEVLRERRRRSSVRAKKRRLLGGSSDQAQR